MSNGTHDRLEQILAELEAAILVEQNEMPTPFAMPPYVVPGELIESMWGNSVVDELIRQENAHTAADAQIRTDYIAADVVVTNAYTAAIAAHAAQPITSAMILDGTILNIDLNAEVLRAPWVAVDMSGSNWSGPWGQVKKIGNVVLFKAQATVAGIGTGVGSIPAGYRPLATVYVVGADISAGTSFGVAIEPNGNVTKTGSHAAGHVLVANGHWETTP